MKSGLTPIALMFVFILLTGLHPIAACVASGIDEEPEEFSGPQPGEPLPDCRLKVIFGPDQGKEVGLLDKVGEKPNLVIFVHEVTRPSVGLVRLVANYGRKREVDSFATQIIFLTADPTETENWMNRARQALPAGVNVSISPDGKEGPGAFGLNRKMQITGIVSKNRKVLDNFAIIQPSLQVDARKLCSAVARSLGDPKMPTNRELGIESQSGRMAAGKYEKLMRPFIQKTNTGKMVETQARAIEAAAARDAALRKRIHEVSNRIIKAGKLGNYGTPEAQAYLEKWSKEFAPARKNPAREPGPASGKKPTVGNQVEK